jgi:ParB family chromosome partitioning protein
VTQKLLDLAVEAVHPDPRQPRQTFPKEEIDRMAVSAAARGILQPLKVRWDGERQCWILVSGECRLRGAIQAGLTTVPCVAVDGELSEIDILADQITENVVRAALKTTQLARALARIKSLKKCNSRVLAEELGLSGAAITRAEALLTLPLDIQEMVDDGRLAESTAYEISRLEGEQAQRELALAAVGGKLSREKVVDAVRGVVPKRNVVPRSSRVTAKLGGLSITVSGAEPLTWQGLLDGLERLRKEAKKLCDGGKEINELARLRAS